MIFNINESVNKSNSGIESAQYNRFKVFRKTSIPFKLVTVNYHPAEQKILINDGIYDFPLKQNEYLNVYDFFQGFDKAAKFKKNTLDDIDYGIKGKKLTMQYNSQYSKIELLQDNNLLVRLNFYNQPPVCLNLDDYRKLQVAGLEIFDLHGNLVQYKQYTYQGYLSAEEIYNPDNSTNIKLFYDIDKHVVLEQFTNKVKDKLKVAQYVLHDRHHDYMKHVFYTRTNFLTYFYNEVNNMYNDEPINIFVADRSTACQESLLKLDKPAYTVFHFHNSQGGRVEDEMYSIPNNNYEYAMAHINDFDATIVATHKQLVDMKQRLDMHNPIFQIPVGTVSDKVLETKPLPINKRIPNSIVVTARVAPEKQIEDIVYAVKDLKEVYPDIILDVYGYKDGTNNYNEIRRIKYLIEKYDLKDNVKVHDYAQDVATIQQKHQIYALASNMEGFNIALMEGLSQGDVGVVYDVNYGPNELVQNGKNGYVVPLNNWRALRDKIHYLFEHKDVMQEMSTQAWKLSKRFSNDVVYQQWQKIISDAYSKA